jgi:hypothetical protein
MSIFQAPQVADNCYISSYFLVSSGILHGYEKTLFAGGGSGSGCRWRRCMVVSKQTHFRAH